MRRSLAILGVLLATAAACAAPVGSAEPRSRSASPGVPSPTEAAPAASSTARVTASPATALARHLTFELTDVRSGEKFTLGAFAGKVVLVQAMAVW